MTRAEIIARAESGIGALVHLGQGELDPNAGGGTGPDCSGFTLKCWEVPRTMLYQEEDGVNASIYPRYTSYDFYNCLGPGHGLAAVLCCARVTSWSRTTAPPGTWSSTPEVTPGTRPSSTKPRAPA